MCPCASSIMLCKDPDKVKDIAWRYYFKSPFNADRKSPKWNKMKTNFDSIKGSNFMPGCMIQQVVKQFRWHHASIKWDPRSNHEDV